LRIAPSTRRSLCKRASAYSFRLPDSLDDRARVDALVDVERDGRDFERSPLGSTGPNELWIEMRIVSVGFLAAFAIRLQR
jgi:hypothetical protein